MKILDRFIIKSFIPPFLATFFISLFVLVLQFFWNYIDDILGKGVGMLYFLEFLFYLSITFLPLSLPIGVLLSSVMVLGNMAEKHELTTIKSAGVPLLRTMAPLIILCVFIAGLSFYSNNNLIPYANLKKYSRLYDLKKSKPTMNIAPGVFNDDFSDISIYVQDKEKETDKLSGVMIYDHSDSRKYSLVTADSGYMQVDDATNQMMMTLFDGEQYQEDFSNFKMSSSRFPFVRMKFEKWQRFLDLSEFEVDKTDENLFRGNRKIMKSGELLRSIDSLKNNKIEREQEFKKYLSELFPLDKEEDTNQKDPAKHKEKPDRNSAKIDFRLHHSPVECMNTGDNFLEDIHFKDRNQVVRSAISSVNTMVNHAKNTSDRWHYKNEKLVKYISELHQKFSLAFTCILFLFIGAPMGAIIRKGGFGYPLLVSIIFFVFYIVLMTYFRKMAESFQIDAVLGSWMPNIVLLPFGVFFTLKAMNDLKFVNFNLNFKKLFRWVRKSKN